MKNRWYRLRCAVWMYRLSHEPWRDCWEYSACFDRDYDGDDVNPRDAVENEMSYWDE